MAQTLQQPEREIKKHDPKNSILYLPNCPKILPKPFQNPSQTPPTPFKLKPKWSPEASKSPFGERSEYKPQKKTLNSCPRCAENLQTYLKTLPTPFPNRPQIDKKTQAKKTVFLEACFLVVSSILVPKQLNFQLCFSIF